MLGIAAKVGIGLAVTATVTIAVAVAVAPSGPEQAVVTGHVDGDTFDGEVNGGTKRIRLINIDTPETKDPATPVECLGQEASDFLAELLPVGTPVRLEFDKDREDQYDRAIAAAFVADGRMVNAEVARAGFAEVVTYGENVRFRPPIEEAWRDAAANKRGLYSSDVTCTVPAQVVAATRQVEQAPKAADYPPTRSSVDIVNASGLVGIARGTVLTLIAKAEQGQLGFSWRALMPGEQTAILAELRTARDAATREIEALQAAGLAAKQREDDAARAAAQAEADRIAREQAAAHAAEEQRAEAARAAEERRAAAEVQRAVEVPDSGPPSRRTGNSGHPCLPGERDGDGDGYCGEGR